MMMAPSLPGSDSIPAGRPPIDIEEIRHVRVQTRRLGSGCRRVPGQMIDRVEGHQILGRFRPQEDQP